MDGFRDRNFLTSWPRSPANCTGFLVNSGMKRVYLITYLILVEWQGLPAQEINKATKLIELDKPGKGETLFQSMNFSGVRFFDNRIDTSSLGSIRDMYIKNPNGTSAWIKGGKVNFSNSLTDELNSYVKSNFKGSFTSTGDSLLVVINYFRVSSKSEEFPDDEPQLVKLNLLFARKNANQTSIVGEYDSLLVFKSRSYQTYYTGPIKKALREILITANNLLTAGVSPSETWSEDAFLKRYTGRPGARVLQNALLKRGVYANFQQLLTNSPQYVNYEPAYADVASYNIVAKDSSGAEVGWKQIWGYSDGNTVYVFGNEANSAVYPLIKEGNSLTISLKSPDSAGDRSRTRVANGFMLVAAVLSRGAAGSAVDIGVILPTITEKVGRKTYRTTGTEINIQTGEIDF
jgi:hypothetical protein